MEPIFPGAVQDAIILSAAFATLGWLYAARRARTLSKNQHTITAWIASSSNERVREAQSTMAPILRGEKSFPHLDSEEFRNIDSPLRIVLNYYEFLAASIRGGHMNEQLVRDLQGGSIITAFEGAEEYIAVLRVRRGKPALFEHLEWIHRRWKRSPPGKLQRMIEWVRGAPFSSRGRR